MAFFFLYISHQSPPGLVTFDMSGVGGGDTFLN